MIKPIDNIVFYNLLKWYIHHIIQKDFEKIVFEPCPLSFDKSVLLLGNHFSWWDGFFPFYLNNLHFKKKFYILMLEDKLREFPMFRYVGAYSIQPGTRSAIESLRYTAELLKNPQNIVVFFPQGRIQSLYQENPTFEKGISKILDNITPQETQVVLGGYFPDYLANRRPTLFVRWKIHKEENNFDFERIKTDFITFQHTCKQQQATREI